MYWKLIRVSVLFSIALLVINCSVYSSWWGNGSNRLDEEYLKRSWQFCRLQQKSEEIQDSNTGWFYCAEGAAGGGAAGGVFLGPLGAVAGAIGGCIAGAANDTILRKLAGSGAGAGDRHARYLACMNEKLLRVQTFVNGSVSKPPQMSAEEIELLYNKCPNESADVTAPCEAAVQAVLKGMKKTAEIV